MDVVAPVKPGWTLVDLCNLISKTLLGEDAGTLREHPDLDQSSLLVLPVWAWVKPGRSLGRKERAGPLFPARVRWDDDGPTVRLVDPGTAVSLRWSIDGLGITDEGTCKVEPDPHEGLRLVEGTLPPNVTADADHLAAGDDHAPGSAQWLAETGEHARWELLQLLETVTRTALERAHAGLVAEYAHQVYGDPSAASGPILHPETLETMRLRIVYGTGDEKSGKEPPMTRVLRDMHDPATFTNVEPQRWLRVRVGKLARNWVSREAGDPEEGPRIRRVARELGVTDPGQVSAALDGIGTKRVEDALALAPNPDALGVPFNPRSGDIGLLDSRLHARR
ncbi:MAG: hypothetical protein L0H93_18120 [Nocardioides sp.]|nr:hypothetical protein [Nocardioides sp.]